MENIVQKTKDKLAEYEKRHQGILDAAMRLFSANGYAATTTVSIAREAGVTEKTMYRHFENKEVLFGACVLSIAGEMNALWENAQEGNKENDLAYLKALSGSYMDFVINNPDKAMFLVQLYSYRVVPELDQGFRNVVAEQLNKVEKIFEALQKKGEIRHGMHPRLLAGAFIGQYFTAVFLNEFLGPELYNRETSMDLTRHFWGIN